MKNTENNKTGLYLDLECFESPFLHVKKQQTSSKNREIGMEML